MCLEPFETLKESSKTVCLMKIFTLDTKEYVLKDIEILTQNQKGYKGVTCTCKGDHRNNSKHFKCS